MGTYISNRNSNGKTDENGHFRLPIKMLDGNIFSGFEIAPTETPSMSVLVKKGDIKIPYDDYAYACWSDEDVTVKVPTADASNNRIDSVVAYVDRTMTFTETDINNPGALKIVDVSGTASTSPVAPTGTQIQNAIGAGNPYVELGRITVTNGTSAIYSTNINTSIQVPTSLSSNVKVDNIVSSDGKKFKFVVLPESQQNNLPSAEADTTIVVFITKGN